MCRRAGFRPHTLILPLWAGRPSSRRSTWASCGPPSAPSSEDRDAFGCCRGSLPSRPLVCSAGLEPEGLLPNKDFSGEKVQFFADGGRGSRATLSFFGSRVGPLTPV